MTDLAARTQADLDDEISTLASRMLLLKRERNARSWISRLPPEVTSQIFLWYQRMLVEDRKFARWRKITQIYSHWREIALRTQILWSDIPLTASHPYVVDALGRAGGASLSVNTRWWYYRRNAIEPAVGHLVLSLAHRLKVIEVDGRGAEIFLASIISDHASYHALTSLSIRTPTRRALMPTFIAAIATLPSLVHLELEGAAYNYPDTQPTPFSIVTEAPFPNLRSFIAHDDLSVVVPFIQSMHINKLTELAVHIKTVPLGELGHFTKLVQLINKLLFESGSRRVNYAKVCQEKLHVSKESSAFLVLCSEDMSSPPFLRISITRGPDSWAPRWIEDVQRLSISHASALSVRLPSFTTVEDWENSQFPKLTNLSRLRFYDACSCASFLKYLTGKASRLDKDALPEGTWMPFPALKVLHLRGIPFDKRWEGMLIDALTTRDEEQCNLEGISLGGCAISEEGVARLEKLVGYVMRDGPGKISTGESPRALSLL